MRNKHHFTKYLSKLLPEEINSLKSALETIKTEYLEYNIGEVFSKLHGQVCLLPYRNKIITIDKDNLRRDRNQVYLQNGISDRIFIGILSGNSKITLYDGVVYPYSKKEELEEYLRLKDEISKINKKTSDLAKGYIKS